MALSGISSRENWGPHTMNKKALVFKRYVFTKDIPCEAPRNKKPTVGMRKRRLVRN